MLTKMEEYAKEHNIPIMQKDGIEYLCKFIEQNNIKKILEIGSAIGYSAISMALISESISITTIEKDEKRYHEAIQNIKNFKLENRIKIYHMDASDYEPIEKYDLIFIDASKGKNKLFFEKFNPFLNDKGFVITDNLSFHGLVEDENLIKTKNQRGIVNKIKDYIKFLNEKNDYQTTYADVGDKIAISRKKENSKYVVIPKNIDNLKEVIKHNIEGIIVSIDNLAVSGNFYINLLELEEIITIAPNVKIFVSLNKIMHNEDLKYLEDVIKKLNNLNIYKILFYDIAVYNIAKKYNLLNKLMIYQEHLNRSVMSHKFYSNKGIKSSYITSDITKREIDEIKKITNMEIMMNVYGCIPMFYSRRYLIDSYFKYIMQDKKDSRYYLEHDNIYYLIIEEKTGTSIYTEKINLINRIKELSNIDYLVINMLDEENNNIIDNFLNFKIVDTPYEGFYNVESYFKLKGDE